MKLSIVSGTYNRITYLREMMQSARESLPASIPLEFVIVDGGSTDGTIEFLRTLPDVTLIEHGELRGAIAAFTDGAFAATGDYVVMANDDITFQPRALLRALTYLDSHPTCGAVAFADKRPAPGYEGYDYKVQSMNARAKDGTPINVYYAQVGMYRKWLGDVCGWWGAERPEFAGRTYGGDNYLSARIWEYGYTVDAVAGVRIDDHVAADELRETNYKTEFSAPGGFYRLYPQGVMIADAPQADNPQREQMRVVYLPIYEPGYPDQKRHKRGLREAFQRVGMVYEVDYLNEPFDLAQIVDDFQPHLIFTQVQDPRALDVLQLNEARKAKPDIVIANWNGDVYPDGLISEDMIAFLRHIDLQLVVNGDVLPVYAEHDIDAAYWQIGFEPVDYDNLPDAPAHDVVFLGNCYSDARKELAAALRRTGVNAGIYGRGWQDADGDTLYNFTAGAALYHHAKIAIGDNQWGNKGFVSNRMFESLASGVLLLHQTVPGLEDLTGLQDGVHYLQWHDLADLERKITDWVRPYRDKDRQRIAQAGREFVHERHSFDARLNELFGIIIPSIASEKVLV